MCPRPLQGKDELMEVIIYQPAKWREDQVATQ